ncbi:MAG: DNA oxidative demethylase AlkB [Steroidobacteraceae bacterium]
MNLELFEPENRSGERETLGRQAAVLRGFALPRVPELLDAMRAVEHSAPFRHMQTPGGFTMSVALTNCGSVGWTSDRCGYRYAAEDPLTGRNWPALPRVFLQLARDAALELGFADYSPDACLVNRYVPGSRLSLHQDRSERDLQAPVVSVSLGIPAIFLFGGMQRSGRCRRVQLVHGDVVVWGGVDRMRFHGVLPVKTAQHSLLGEQRVNFTFRKV